MALSVDRPVIGRPEIRRALALRHAEVLEGHGALSILEGEVGVGKSTLLDAFLGECRRRGERVLRARARRSVDPPPVPTDPGGARGRRARDVGSPRSRGALRSGAPAPLHADQP